MTEIDVTLSTAASDVRREPPDADRGGETRAGGEGMALQVGQRQRRRDVPGRAVRLSADLGSAGRVR